MIPIADSRRRRLLLTAFPPLDTPYWSYAEPFRAARSRRQYGCAVLLCCALIFKRNKLSSGPAELAGPRHITATDRPGPFVATRPRANGVRNATVLHRQELCDQVIGRSNPLRIDLPHAKPVPRRTLRPRGLRVARIQLAIYLSGPPRGGLSAFSITMMSRD